MSSSSSDETDIKTLCLLNQQSNKFLQQRYVENLKREEKFTDRTESLFNKLFSKIEEVKSDMGKFRNEIDDRVEKCSKKMAEDIGKVYVTKIELEIMTGKLMKRMTLVGAMITVAILVAKFLITKTAADK